MGLLDGSLAGQIYQGFKGKLSAGIIRQQGVPTSGALDPRGDPIDLGEPVNTYLEGFAEEYDDAYKARAGIPAEMVKVNIFGQSCPSITPAKEDLVRLTRAGVDTWYALKRVTIDPAGALWTCRAVVIGAPE